MRKEDGVPVQIATRARFEVDLGVFPSRAVFAVLRSIYDRKLTP
jgi:hypothetical protein